MTNILLTLLISFPSIKISPSSNSTSLISDAIIVDFPAPVRPIIPTLLKAGTLTLKFFKAGANSGLYFKAT